MNQLPLICPMPNRRPRTVTEIMRKQAAEAVAKQLARFIPELGDHNETVSDILAVTDADCTMDGYQIARALEQHKHWDCDMAIAEIVDRYSTLCGDLLRAAEEQWGKENPMEPPYPVGVWVSTPYGIGRISEVYPRAPNSYLVLIDNRRILVPFEDTHEQPDRCSFK